ncbi:hypothetical protein [Nocardioides plantarum]|uniref:Uncharacterized protein n=1 Tax=Nocardioides plantarum TaxID=29299 RepID=A0ABV5KF22_9ACTN|nr:hypothetical protein [Nocardioides plantarum]
MRTTRKLAMLMTSVLAATVTMATPSQAASYTGYTTKAEIPDYDCGSDACTAAQGFAVTRNFLYTIKTDSDHKKSVIYRFNRETGDRELMHNATSDSNVNTWLGHANDMQIVTVGDQTYMFVVTMFGSDDGANSAKQLVKLKYDGTSYEWDHTYNILNGTDTLGVSGLSKISQNGNTVDFFFSTDDKVYHGSLDVTAEGGSANDIHLAKAFTMNGKPDGWASQGVHYDAATQRFYRPITRANRSRVLVYDNIAPTISLPKTQPVSPNSGIDIDITSANYAKFEIEGVGISPESNKLYFSTNRTGNNDGVHYVTGYAA